MNSLESKATLHAELTTLPTSRHVKLLRVIELLTEFEQKCIFVRSRIEKAATLQELGADMSIDLALSLGVNYEKRISESSVPDKNGSFRLTLPGDPLAEIEIYLIELGLSADAKSLKADYEFAWDSLDRLMRASARGFFEADVEDAATPEQIREILGVISDDPPEQLAEIAANWSMAIRRTRDLSSILQVLPETSGLSSRRALSTATPEKPKVLLKGWGAILDALGLHRDQENAVRRWNQQYSGPIVIPGQGKKPVVNKADLIVWWNGMEDRYAESVNRTRDRNATIAGQYCHGRDGVAVPGIAGAIKRRRKGRHSSNSDNIEEHPKS